MSSPENHLSTVESHPPLERVRLLLLPLLSLFLVGFSVGLAFFLGWFLSDRQALLLNNGIPFAVRLRGLGGSLLLGTLTALGAVVWANRKRPFEIVALERGARLLAPLGLSAFIPLLFVREAFRDREFWHLVLVGCLGLVFEKLLRGSFREWPERWRLSEAGRLTWQRNARWLWGGGVLLCALYYFFHVGHLSVVSHHKLATSSSDLAEFDNLFFNALQGHPFRAPAIEGELRDWSAFKVHAEFGLYFLLPFYAIAPGPEALLWIQTGIVAATAIPIFLLAQARLGSLAGFVFGAGYLLLPVVERPNFYDFHFTPWGMMWIAWLFYFLNASLRRPNSRLLRVGIGVTFLVALLAREDVSLGLAVLGVFLFFEGRLARTGLVMALTAAAYFVIVKFGIMPRFGKMWFDTMYEDLKAPGSRGFSAVILTLVTNPAFVVRSLFIEPKGLYFLHMTVPLLFLWVRRPALWLALLPGFVSTLLVTNRPPLYESSFQYTYLWVPYVMGASILGLEWWQSKERHGIAGGRAALGALALVLVLVGHQHGILLGGDRIKGGFQDKNFEWSEAEAERLQQLQRLVAQIPADASVAATEAEGPHVSTRLVMYSLKFTLGDRPDYLLLGHPGIRSERHHLSQALESGEYGLIAREGPFYLVQRGADTKDNGVLQRLVGRR